MDGCLAESDKHCREILRKDFSLVESQSIPKYHTQITRLLENLTRAIDLDKDALYGQIIGEKIWLSELAIAHIQHGLGNGWHAVNSRMRGVELARQQLVLFDQYQARYQLKVSGLGFLKGSMDVRSRKDSRILLMPYRSVLAGLATGQISQYSLTERKRLMKHAIIRFVQSYGLIKVFYTRVLAVRSFFAYD